MVLTWFAHSQLFFLTVAGIHTFLLQNWITKTMNEANMLNCIQICDKGSEFFRNLFHETRVLSPVSIPVQVLKYFD